MCSSEILNKLKWNKSGIFCATKGIKQVSNNHDMDRTINVLLFKRFVVCNFIKNSNKTTDIPISFPKPAVLFSGPQGSWSVHVCCLHLKMEFRSCTRGRQWCGVMLNYWWTASIKPMLLFSRAGYAFWWLSLSSVYFNHKTFELLYD